MEAEAIQVRCWPDMMPDLDGDAAGAPAWDSTKAEREPDGDRSAHRT
jgi:hypothetical protein